MDDVAGDRMPGSSIAIALLLASAVVLPSALLYALPIGHRQIGFGLLLATLGFGAFFHRRIPLDWLVVLVAGVCLTTVTAAYWGELTIVAILGYFVLSMFVVGIATLHEIRRAVEITTAVLLVLIAGGWIAFVYALNGGGPIWNVGNPGQPLSLYVTTLALSIHGVGRAIRPAGIFDEPGAFATFIAFCAGIRMLMGMPRRTTWVLMLTGLITTSLALLIFIFVVGVGELLTRERRRMARGPSKYRALKWAAALAIVGVVAWFAVRYSDEVGTVFSLLFGRLAFSGQEGRLIEGDTRTASFFTSLEQLTVRSVLFGTDRSCFVDVENCYQLELGGTNPLLPILLRGIFAQFLYYLVLAVMFVKAVTTPKKWAVYFGILLMFLQRPYVLAFGYSTWAVLTVMIDGKLAPGRRAKALIRGATVMRSA